MTFDPRPRDQTTFAMQTGIFDLIVKDITDRYFSADYNGLDWKAIQVKYKSLIQKGLKQTDFYKAVNQMVSELGDDNSSVFMSPPDQANQTGATNEGVGIGGSYFALNDQGEDIKILGKLYIFPILLEKSDS